jgi:hypothetical protein
VEEEVIDLSKVDAEKAYLEFKSLEPRYMDACERAKKAEAEGDIDGMVFWDGVKGVIKREYNAKPSRFVRVTNSISNWLSSAWWEDVINFGVLIGIVWLVIWAWGKM